LIEQDLFGFDFLKLKIDYENLINVLTLNRVDYLYSINDYLLNFVCDAIKGEEIYSNVLLLINFINGVKLLFFSMCNSFCYFFLCF
jgi:hypothetical protein